MGLAFTIGFTGYEDPADATKDYVPVFMVTAASIAMLYTFFFVQGYTALAEFSKAKAEYRNKKTDEEPSFTQLKYGFDNLNMTAASRLSGNYMEQLLPFLISMYSFATFVSAGNAAKIGWLWLCFRSYYYPAYKRGPLLFACTMPAYACIWGMLGVSVYKAMQLQ